MCPKLVNLLLPINSRKPQICFLSPCIVLCFTYNFAPKAQYILYSSVWLISVSLMVMVSIHVVSCIITSSPFLSCFPGGSEVKVSACSAGARGSIPGSGTFPWRRKWQPTPVFLPGESHGQRSLEGYTSRGRKESDRTERPDCN